MTIKTAGGLLTASARGEGGGFALVPVLGACSLHSFVGKKAARANSKIPTNTKKLHKKWFYHLRFLP